MEDIGYADLTNDGNEEAIIKISIQTGGSAIPSLIYVYTLKNNQPKLLWGFMTGDRGEGGYKNIYTKNGELIVELLGKNTLDTTNKTFLFQNETIQRQELVARTDLQSLDSNGTRKVLN